MSELTELFEKIQACEMEVMCLRERVGELETELESLTDKPDPHRELSPCCGFEIGGSAEFESDETEYEKGKS